MKSNSKNGPNERFRDVPAAVDVLSSTRTPILIWVALVYLAALILQYASASALLPSLLFTGMVVIHVGLYWFAHLIVATRPWLYFMLQGLIVYFSAYLLPGGSPAILLGLLPVLAGQGIGIYYKRAKAIVLTVFLYALSCLALIVLGRSVELAFLLPLFTLMLVVVGSYARLFFHQVEARVRTQAFLQELEVAHRQVEELTLTTERQRMARDLHDTLAQGLSGLIMQLEAINAHLDRGNSNRAREIVHQSMQRAREALSDARRAIDNLRDKSASAIDFSDAIREEVRRFVHATGISIDSDIDPTYSISLTVMEHSRHMITECLTNIARHAEADHVRVSVKVDKDALRVGIEDNGKGFATELIGKQPGHYGLLGLYERARLIGGKLEIVSRPRQGTSATFTIPLRGEPI
ncbi:sensor histidine kinase [Paenibacillus flagellatus]|uniref:histidine kinase n=1 Tax=Paenibacillus flagellatus TaxID=2211139 RepID=A0A2V5K2D0_9BACL|nr:sensor histidine kinase [Paenibacillus flagellatus]PYI53359.1 sensor histidine kinase [Paenibacillus flagellatus]